VIGLGTIGGGIAVSLARRGRVPAVYDVRLDAAMDLPGVPEPLSSPAEVAQDSDLLFVAVVDDAQVRNAIEGADGILAGAHRDLVVAITSTVAVSVVRQVSQYCWAHGVTVLDCGVNLGSRAASNGLLLFVGGPEAVVTRVGPVFHDIASTTIYCGSTGAGMATKLGCQAVTAGRWRAVHEAVELTSAAGVDPHVLVSAVEASDPDGSSLMRLQRLRMTRSEFDEFSRPVRHYARNLDKDLDAIQQLSRDTGVGIPLIDVARSHASDTFGWIANLPDPR
jgi:3-hydroxyisobutyrate dehydrogenase-like beta-hydroxyacid dehydrogenase